MPILPNPILGGPWRILVLDRDVSDPKWLLATVSLPLDVHPALITTDGRYAGWRNVCEWVHAQVGQPVALTPITMAAAWRIDEGGTPR